MRQLSRYQLYGFTLETAWPLKTRLVETRDEPDLRFSVVDRAPKPGPWARRDHRGGGDEDSAIEVGQVGSIEVLRFSVVGNAWFVSSDEIAFHLTHPENDFQVEMALLGVLAAYWLEQRGVAALHASGVAGDGWSIGFMGPNRTGKTSLALELTGVGHRFLTDDVLAVSMTDCAVAFPSFPQARLWPDEARRLLGTTSGLEPAHPYFEKLRVPIEEDQMAHDPSRLVALYLRRTAQNDGNKIERVEGARALFHLMFNTFVRELIDVPSLRGAWLHRLGALLEKVPIFSLSGLGSEEPSEEAKLVAEHAAQVATQSNRSG